MHLTSKKVFLQALFLGLLIFISCSNDNKLTRQTDKPVHRIVSFAPSITETLFALGLGDKVVGVTNFCTYPAQVKKLPRIGGYIDPNFEMILRLKPDLVISLKEHASVQKFLADNKITSLAINNENLAGVLESFKKIGVTCGASVAADSLVLLLDRELAADTGVTVRPSVLFCVGRDNPGSGSVSKVFAAGVSSIYTELIYTAGGKNILVDTLAAYPALSTEAIIRLAPDVIIDIMGSVTNVDPQRIAHDWDQILAFAPKKSSRVYCLTGDYISIPGPRIVSTVRDLRLIIAQHRDLMVGRQPVP